MKELGTIPIVTEKSDPHIDIKPNPARVEKETYTNAESVADEEMDASNSDRSIELVASSKFFVTFVSEFGSAFKSLPAFSSKRTNGDGC